MLSILTAEPTIIGVEALGLGVDAEVESVSNVIVGVGMEGNVPVGRTMVASGKVGDGLPLPQPKKIPATSVASTTNGYRVKIFSLSSSQHRSQSESNVIPGPSNPQASPSLHSCFQTQPTPQFLLTAIQGLE